MSYGANRLCWHCDLSFIFSLLECLFYFTCKELYKKAFEESVGM